MSEFENVWGIQSLINHPVIIRQEENIEQELILLDLTELLNQLQVQFPQSKISLGEVEGLLELLRNRRV